MIIFNSIFVAFCLIAVTADVSFFVLIFKVQPANIILAFIFWIIGTCSTIAAAVYATENYYNQKEKFKMTAGIAPEQINKDTDQIFTGKVSIKIKRGIFQGFHLIKGTTESV